MFVDWVPRYQVTDPELRGSRLRFIRSQRSVKYFRDSSLDREWHLSILPPVAHPVEPILDQAEKGRRGCFLNPEMCLSQCE